jgi:hypothetical protein
MIVMPIAFGRPYIDSFFDRCLPSLMTPNNFPAITGDPLTLFFCTTESSVPYLRQRIRTSEYRDIFGGRVNIHFIPFEPVDTDDALERVNKQRKVTYSLLIHGIKFCLARDESFVTPAPDGIYSDGIIESNWELHRLTGKVVSNFVARVEDAPGGSDFYREMIQRPSGVKDYFFGHPEERWFDHVTNDPDQLPGETVGFQILNGRRAVHIFSNPSPFMGKFQPEDLFKFLEVGTYGAWDHEWLTFLVEKGRALVQTNLDLGMVIEPWSDGQGEDPARKTRGVERDIKERREHFLGKDADAFDVMGEMKKQRFGNPLNQFCFSTILDKD